jgi:hypothetical protein
MMRNRLITLGVLILAIFLMAFVPVFQTRIRNLNVSGDLDVDGTSNLDIVDIDGAVDFATTATVGTGLTVTSGGATVTAGGITVTDGDVVVADDLRATAQTSITVTNAAAFTPTGTYQPITAAGEVTPTITAGATAGDILVLINTSAQIINLADSGTLKLTAAGALNQFDTLTLWSDGTNWIEISRADN